MIVLVYVFRLLAKPKYDSMPVEATPLNKIARNGVKL